MVAPVLMKENPKKTPEELAYMKENELGKWAKASGRSRLTIHADHNKAEAREMVQGSLFFSISLSILLY